MIIFPLTSQAQRMEYGSGNQIRRMEEGSGVREPGPKDGGWERGQGTIFGTTGISKFTQKFS